MPGNHEQLYVDLVFGSDTAQAEAGIKRLQTSLSNLLTQGNQNFFSNSSQEIRAASTELTKFSAILKNSFNADTNKLDLTKFNTNLKEAGMSAKDLRGHFEAFGVEGRKAYSELTDQIMSAEVPLKKNNALVEQFFTTLKNTARWMIASNLLTSVLGTFQHAFSYAQDLNKSLNDIRIVTSKSKQEMEAFAIEANKAAKTLSATTTEYTKASLIYFQQGLSDAEVKRRTDATVKMANVTGESVQQMSDELTSVWNNFMEAGDTNYEHYLDIMTKLGAETASSSEEISQGLQKFSGIAKTVGLSFEVASAALTTITDRTRQSADIVGTSLKTIFSRIEGLKLGETLEDGTDLNKYSEALATVGVQIKDEAGNLKDADEIIMDLGHKWKTLARDQQMALAQTVGGVRQYNQIMSLMSNFDFFEENLERARTASGTLDEQAEIYAESWEAAKKRISAAAEEIYDKLINDNFFIDLTDAGSDLLEMISNGIDMLGGVPGLLSTILNIVLRITNSSGVLAKELRSLAIPSMKTQQSIAKDRQAEFVSELGQFNSKIFDMGQYDNETKATTKALMGKQQLNLDLINSSEKMSDLQIEISKSYIEQFDMLSKIVEKQAQEVDNAEHLKDTNFTDTIVQRRWDILNALDENSFNKEAYESIAAMSHQQRYKKANINVDTIDTVLSTAGLSSLSKTEAAAIEDVLAGKGTAGTKAWDQAEKAVKRYIEALQLLEQQLNKLGSDEYGEEIDQKFTNIASTYVDFANKINAISFKSPQEGLQIFNTEVKNLSGNLSNILGDTDFNLDKFILDFLPADSTKVQSVINQRIKNIKAQVINKIDEEIKALGAKDPSLKGEEYVNLAKKKQEMEKVLGEFEQIGQKYSTKIKSYTEAQQDWADSIAKTAQGITGLASAISALSGIWKTLENPDLTPFEKITSITMSLGMAIGQLVSSMSALRAAKIKDTTVTLLNSFAEKINAKAKRETAEASNKVAEATKKEVVAQQADTTENMVQAGSEAALKKASSGGIVAGSTGATGAGATGATSVSLAPGTLSTVAAAAGEVLVVLLAIAAVAATIYAYWKLFQKTEEALEQANKDLEDATKIAESAKSAYDELKSSIEQIESKRNALETQTKGTLAYKEALMESNQAVLDLINSNQDLSISMLHGTADTGYYLLNEDLEMAQQAAMDRSTKAMALQMSAQYQVQKAQNASMIDSFLSQDFRWAKQSTNQKDFLDTARGLGALIKNHPGITAAALANPFALATTSGFQGFAASSLFSALANTDDEVAAMNALGDALSSAESTEEAMNIALKELGLQNADLTETEKKQIEAIIENTKALNSQTDFDNALQIGKAYFEDYLKGQGYSGMDLTLAEKQMGEKVLELSELYKKGLGSDISEKNLINTIVNEGYLDYLYGDIGQITKDKDTVVLRDMSGKEIGTYGINGIVNSIATGMAIKTLIEGTPVKDSSLVSVQRFIDWIKGFGSTSFTDLFKGLVGDIAANGAKNGTLNFLTNTLFKGLIGPMTSQEEVDAKRQLQNVIIGTPDYELDAEDFVNFNFKGVELEDLKGTIRNSIVNIANLAATEALPKLIENLNPDEMDWATNFYNALNNTSLTLLTQKQLDEIWDIINSWFAQKADSTLASSTEETWKKDKKYLSDVQKRYHDINNTLQLMQNNYKRISTLAEHAFGKTKISYLKALNEQLKESNKADEYKLQLMQKQTDLDRQALAEVGGQFNEYGQLTNYDELLTQWVEEYNTAKDDDKDRASARLEEKLRLMETYENSFQETQEQQQKVLENQYAEQANELEIIKQSLDFQLNITNSNLALLDYQLSKISDNAFEAATKISILGDQLAEAADNNELYIKALKDTLGVVLTEEEIAKFMSGDDSVFEGKNFSTELIEQLTGIRNSLLENTQIFTEKYKEALDTIIGLFDAIRDSVNTDIELLNAYNETFDNLSNIIDLSEKANDKHYGNLRVAVAQGLEDSAAVNTKAQEYDLAVLYRQLNSLQMAYETAPEEQKAYLDQQINAVNLAIENKKRLIEKSYINQVKAAENTYKEIVKTAQDAYDQIVSGAFKSIDEVDTYLKKYSEQREVYLETYEKEYELNKLLRNIDKQLSDSSQLKSNQRLLDLKQKISDAASNTAQMSKVELEMLQKQYDVEVARLALEETRNAKDRVTLVQGSEGNMYYAYSADLDKVDQATQNYEDALKAQKDSIFQWTEKLNSSFISLVKIVKDDTGKYSKAYKDWAQKELYNILRQRGAIDTALNYLNPEDAALLSFSNSTLGQMFSGQSLNQLATQFSGSFDTMFSTITQAEDTLQDKTNKIFEQLGFSTQNFEEDIIGTINRIEQENDTLIAKMEEKYGENGSLTKKIKETDQAFADLANTWLGKNQDGPMYQIVTGNEVLVKQTDKIIAAIAGEDDSVVDAFIEWKLAVHGVVVELDTLLEKIKDIGPSLDGLSSDESEESSSGTSTPSPSETIAGAIIGKGISNGANNIANNREDQVVSATIENTTIDPKQTYNDPWLTNSNSYSHWVPEDNAYVINLGEKTGLNNDLYQVYKLNKENGKIIDKTNRKMWINSVLMDTKEAKKQFIAKKYPKYKGFYLLKEGTPFYANFDTGGYTGAWGPEGKLAVLHQKELVLNADDTKRMLLMTQIARSVAQQVDLTAKYGLSTAGLVPYRTGSSTTASSTEQTVNIHAEFPGVTDSVEIKRALDNLMNTASHYANRK